MEWLLRQSQGQHFRLKRANFSTAFCREISKWNLQLDLTVDSITSDGMYEFFVTLRKPAPGITTELDPSA
jgi:hypothetical protein